VTDCAVFQVLDHGALACTLLVEPGAMDFVQVPGLIKGVSEVLSGYSWSLFQKSDLYITRCAFLSRI
jgi:hypothetical protein